MRTMLVQLNRPLRGDEEFRRLADALPVTAFHSTTDSSNIALGVEVEANSRVDAERLAYELVVRSGAISASEIERVTGDDDLMQERQVMFWVVGTRHHLREWELRLAEQVRLGLNDQQAAGSLIWATELAHHFALVAAHNLLRALDNAEGRFQPMPQAIAKEIELLRNLHEHWDEQRPSFYNVNQPGPLRRSGKEFAELHPGLSPFSALSWSSDVGPRFGPGVPAKALHDYLDALQAEVLLVAPRLAGYGSPTESSPWLGPAAGRDQWWPRASLDAS